MKTLVDAGYSANSAAAMFKQMLNASRLYGNKTPEFLLTHPITESRIAEARNRARQYNSPTSKLHLNYLLIKTRTYVLAQESNKNSISHFSSQLEKFSIKRSIEISSSEALYAEAARYGLALSYQRDQQWRKPYARRLRQSLDARAAGATHDAWSRAARRRGMFRRTFRHPPSTRATPCTIYPSLVTGSSVSV